MSNVNFLATKVYEDISKAVDDGYNLIVEEGSSRSSVVNCFHFSVSLGYKTTPHKCSLESIVL